MICPACGFPDLKEPPRSSDGGRSYEICWSCGFQFGVTDDDRGYSYESWRQHWIDRGMPWDSEKVRRPPPPDWDPTLQLQRLLEGP